MKCFLLLALGVGCDAAYVINANRPKLPLRTPSLQLSALRSPQPKQDDCWLKEKATVAGPCLLTLLAAAAPAEAATSAAAVPSAFVAYGHYLALVLTVGALVTERLTVKPDMTKEEEERIALADIIYGGAGLLVLVTGYLRVTQYGKGWEFYSHEPLFWLKMVLVAVMGAASFFPTTKIIQRSVAMRGDNPPAPMTEKLASRMTSIINAELLAVASIPLTAALMARGVGYADWFPWQAGAALVAVSIGGLGFKYVKEALDWQE